jgi:hypothetical protein
MTLGAKNAAHEFAWPSIDRWPLVLETAQLATSIVVFPPAPLRDNSSSAAAVS